MPRTSHCLTMACLALLAAGASRAQDPVSDARLDHFEVVPVREGAVTINASVGIAVCGAAHSFMTSLQLLRDGVVAGEVPVAVATAIGGSCGTTQNGHCSGVVCPDAVVNGKTKHGTCSNGSGGYCVCDYGIASAVFENVAVVAGSFLELVLDGGQRVQEISEANNYGSVTVAAGGRADVYRLDEPATLESLRRTGLIPAASMDGVAFTDGGIEQTGDVQNVVLSGVDALGNCRTWAAELIEPGIISHTTHSCTGNPCSSCQFTYNVHHQITGCTCAAPSGTCNHTITSG